MHKILSDGKISHPVAEIKKERVENYEKIEIGENAGKFKRIVKQEEIVEITLEEIERMERNANTLISNSNQIIAEMNKKLEECKKLRQLINDIDNQPPQTQLE